MFDYNIRKQVSFALGCSLIVRCCRASLDGPAYPNGSKVRFFSCSVFYLLFYYFIGVLQIYVRFLCDYDTRNKIFYFPMGDYLAVRCCRATLVRPAYPSGSQVRFFSCSVIYNHEYFIGVLKSTYDFCVIMTLKSKYMYFFSIRWLLGCTLLSYVVGGTRVSMRQPGTFIFMFCYLF